MAKKKKKKGFWEKRLEFKEFPKKKKKKISQFDELKFV